jgi:hypothetical protein
MGLSDAQVSMFQVIRPITNFEAVYEGKPGTVPIAFPGTLDPQAGQPGFDANLLKGIPVPLGGRMLVQIPMTIDMYTSRAIYGYQFLWRTRNQQAFRDAISTNRQGVAYHLPSEELGRKERQGFPGELYFIPASSDVEIFEEAEPGTNVPAVLNVRQQIYVPKLADSWVQPLTAGGAGGVWQQGAYQFSSNVNCSGPTWFPLWLDVGGDELLILVYKIDTAAPWAFGTTDLGFSNTYGNNAGGLPVDPNIGILLATGTMGN